MKRQFLYQLINEWLTSSDIDMPLWQYLGMTYEEYCHWAYTDELPPGFETYDT